jgi:hypothetical protein
MQEQLLLTAMALFAGAALVLSFLHWKAHRVDPGLLHQKAQREFLHRLVQGVDPGLPHQKAKRVDPRIEHEFNKLFMTTSKEGKEALIERWMARQKCGRLEAMRLATEEWRRENR